MRNRMTGRHPFKTGKNIRVQGMSGTRVQALDGCSSCGGSSPSHRAGPSGPGMSGMLEDLLGIMSPASVAVAGAVGSAAKPSPGTPFTPTSPIAAQMREEAIAGAPLPTGASLSITQLQTLLRSVECNPGTIDGVWGPRTSSAVRCFISRGGRVTAAHALGSRYVLRAERDARSGATRPRPETPSPSTLPDLPGLPGLPSSGDIAPGGILDISGLLRQVGIGGAAGADRTSALSFLADPVFLGLVGLGLVGGMVVYYKVLKPKKKGK